MFSFTQQIGFSAESQACRYLKKHGLRLQEKNFRCPQGEIDLIMSEGEHLVFVEVRYRRQNKAFADAVDSVDHRKQQKLIKAAHTYLQQKGLWDKVSWRFDIVGIDQAAHEKKAQITWIKDAFTLK